MRRQSPLPHESIGRVIVLSLITLGIYSLYWAWRLGDHLRRSGEGSDIPHFVWMLVPFANLWWYWRWSLALEDATDGRIQHVPAFVLVAIFGVIGVAVTQHLINERSPDTSGPILEAAP